MQQQLSNALDGDNRESELRVLYTTWTYRRDSQRSKMFTPDKWAANTSADGTNGLWHSSWLDEMDIVGDPLHNVWLRTVVAKVCTNSALAFPKVANMAYEFAHRESIGTVEQQAMLKVRALHGTATMMSSIRRLLSPETPTADNPVIARIGKGLYSTQEKFKQPDGTIARKLLWFERGWSENFPPLFKRLQAYSELLWRFIATAFDEERPLAAFDMDCGAFTGLLEQAITAVLWIGTRMFPSFVGPSGRRINYVGPVRQLASLAALWFDLTAAARHSQHTCWYITSYRK